MNRFAAMLTLVALFAAPAQAQVVSRAAGSSDGWQSVSDPVVRAALEQSRRQPQAYPYPAATDYSAQRVWDRSNAPNPYPATTIPAVPADYPPTLNVPDIAIPGSSLSAGGQVGNSLAPTGGSTLPSYPNGGYPNSGYSAPANGLNDVSGIGSQGAVQADYLQPYANQPSYAAPFTNQSGLAPTGYMVGPDPNSGVLPATFNAPVGQAVPGASWSGQSMFAPASGCAPANYVYGPGQTADPYGQLTYVGGTIPVTPSSGPYRGVYQDSPVTATGATAPPGFYMGRWLLGGPKLYAPRQPVRNMIRFLTP